MQDCFDYQATIEANESIAPSPMHSEELAKADSMLSSFMKAEMPPMPPTQPSRSSTKHAAMKMSDTSPTITTDEKKPLEWSRELKCSSLRTSKFLKSIWRSTPMNTDGNTSSGTSSSSLGWTLVAPPPRSIKSQQLRTIHRRPSIHEFRDQSKDTMQRQSTSLQGMGAGHRNTRKQSSGSLPGSSQRLLALIQSVQSIPFGKEDCESPRVPSPTTTRADGKAEASIFPDHADAYSSAQHATSAASSHRTTITPESRGNSSSSIESDRIDGDQSSQKTRRRYGRRPGALSKQSITIKTLPRDVELSSLDAEEPDGDADRAMEADDGTTRYTEQRWQAQQEDQGESEDETRQPHNTAGARSSLLSCFGRNLSRSSQSWELASPRASDLATSLSPRVSPLVLFPTIPILPFQAS